MGLWDTMSHLGANQTNDSIQSAEPGEGETYLSIPDRADAAAHAVAARERRQAFAGWSILDQPGNSQPGQRERRFVGAHSDVGGGYTDSDVSDAALMWMIKQAREQGGLPEATIDNERIDNRGLNDVTSPVVHDEVGNAPFPPERIFRYPDEGPQTDVEQIDYETPYASDLDFEEGMTYLQENIYQDSYTNQGQSTLLATDGLIDTGLATNEDGNYPYESWLHENYGLGPDSPYGVTIGSGDGNE